MSGVPTLDIGRWDDDRAAFVTELGAAYREYGFCCIRGHGVPKALIDEAYAAFVAFFALPDAIKHQYLGGAGGTRGLTPLKVETAKGAAHPDLKEFWHIGRELPPGSKYAATMAPNLWPAEVPGFRAAGSALYDALGALGARVLSALALHLGLDQHWFDDKIDHGNSILRALHYPPIGPNDAAHERAGAHEDINLITLLVGASDGGLEVLSRSGDWLPVTTEGDAIVVNIGDMLQRLSNHVYPSTTHRVVNPKGEAAGRARYSMPYFLHPNPDFLIDVLPSCITAENPSRYPEPITANDYLWQRLREIGLS
ncbi:2-oxoglutarate and iron-dependent oxygenase domain-containing protein [uncultured Nevskia sp.]|uniref:isopenicillin N synthase family dioxygenase n=1 Tax=uncultured Nevskia sp. TaxID=228950 RepID=UPI0025F2450D|nr:2-oxoglutarate and iron-dependent oxygenase domain-containing protein [uncultured Nevskia sp.]